MKEKLLNGGTKIAIIGLGYVGLPLTVAFAKKNVSVIGFDINEKKVDSYLKGIDVTGELAPDDLKNTQITFTSDERKLREASVFIIAVPTPIDDNKKPFLDPVFHASKIVGKNMPKDSLVIYESTVYPGLTEDKCVKILEKNSNMVCEKDFLVGYSPERINPGDKAFKLQNIVKVVSGINEKALNDVADIYEMIIEAGVFRAASIRVAEAIKLVENAQRDVNIAFMNELSIYFDYMNIDTQDVIAGMNTKWNALKFTPGLVGGHCIGVDPYYFIYQSKKINYDALITKSCRKVNDKMGSIVGKKILKALNKSKKEPEDTKIYILGVTFKENCPDTRNSKAEDIIQCLKNEGYHPLINDPWVSDEGLKEQFGCETSALEDIQNADCIVFIVAHDTYKNLSYNTINSWFNKSNNHTSVFDIKRMYDKNKLTSMGHYYWGL